MPRKTSLKAGTRLAEPENDVPTRKDLETVAAFKRLAIKGHEPSTREVAQELGVSQTAAQWRLTHCHRKGLLTRAVVEVLGPYEITEKGKKWLAMAG